MPLTRSPAHIYISALPFAPSDSLVSQHYLPQYPHTLVVKGDPQTWDEPQEEPISVVRACISLDGTRIAAVYADKTFCIYNTTGEGFLLKLDEEPRSMIFSPDGNLVAFGGQALRLWNLQIGKEVESFDIDVYSLAFSPDGWYIAAGCEGNGGSHLKRDGRGSYNIRVIKILRYANVVRDPGRPPGMFTSPGGEGIKLLQGEVPHSPFEGHVNQVNSVAYSRDRKRIASCSDDSTVRVWDVSTGSPTRTFNANSSFIRCLAFSPDDTRIATNTGLFNLSTSSFTPHSFGDKVSSIAFSPNGRFLALASGMACQIWDIASHKTIIRLVGHTDDVHFLSFFPGGQQIMSASKDGSIRIWDANTGIQLEHVWQRDWDVGGFWILHPEGGYLFWTPFPFRHAKNTLVIGDCPKIDFSNFVHGDEWVKCREPLVEQKDKRVRKGW